MEIGIDLGFIATEPRPDHHGRNAVRSNDGASNFELRFTGFAYRRRGRAAVLCPCGAVRLCDDRRRASPPRSPREAYRAAARRLLG
jgi:hypothetical protein